MAETIHTVTDANVGAVLTSGGFLVGVAQTKPTTTPQVPPSFDEGKQIWVSGYFTLRDSKAFRPVICVSPQSSGIPGNTWMTRGEYPVIGDLVAESVPKGSQWQVTTADVLTPRAPSL